MEAVCSPPFLAMLVSSTAVVSNRAMQTDWKYRIHECEFVGFPLDTEVFVSPLSLVTRLRDGLRESGILFEQWPAMGPLSKTSRPAMRPNLY